MNKLDRDLSKRIREWRLNPIQFVWDNFQVDPDEWQKDYLWALASDDPIKQRIALNACAGPGKSAGLAWGGWWVMVCMGGPGEHPKGAAVSTTKDNLEDNLWPEFSKWLQRSQYIRDRFEWSARAVYSKEFPDTWFISARTWNKSATQEEQGRTLSGLHSEYVIVLIDESGDIPVSVLKSGEQAMSNCKWGKIVQAGNPISHAGMLYAASTDLADQWFSINITGDPDNPKRSKRIDITWAREQIEKYGRHDPWVKAYILGEFPEAGFNQLLSPDEVLRSMNRSYKDHEFAHAQKRIGVDAARFGDDPWVFFPRHGMVAYHPLELRGMRTDDIAARLIKGKQKFDSELEFVDGTGGYGSGVIDALYSAGHEPQEIHFSSKALDGRYFNKRTEMWFLMADWVKDKGQLPKDNILKKELCSPMYTFQNGKMKLEDKDQIKKRLGFSPNRADALALTFALPDMPGAEMQKALERIERNRQKREDYDPFSAEHMV